MPVRDLLGLAPHPPRTPHSSPVEHVLTDEREDSPDQICSRDACSTFPSTFPTAAEHGFELQELPAPH